MIKVIAFDLVGVLIRENDFLLNENEQKIERSFKQNLFNFKGKRKNEKIDYIVNNIYDINNKELFKKLKEIYSNIKIVIASNHITNINEYLKKEFDMSLVDDVFISADMHLVKPYKEYYEYILKKMNIEPNELLFLDDKDINIDGAKQLNINTIKVNKDTDIFLEIIKFLKK